jgi:hypothetical protein
VAEGELGDLDDDQDHCYGWKVKERGAYLRKYSKEG